MQTRVSILVVDRMYSIVVELKDDTKENSEETIGLATYSDSKPTVLSYVSIFEALWRQSELRGELMIRSMTEKEFINIASHGTQIRNSNKNITLSFGTSNEFRATGILADQNRIKQYVI
jgi:hypothetical protein